MSREGFNGVILTLGQTLHRIACTEQTQPSWSSGVAAYLYQVTVTRTGCSRVLFLLLTL